MGLGRVQAGTGAFYSPSWARLATLLASGLRYPGALGAPLFREFRISELGRTAPDERALTVREGGDPAGVPVLALFSTPGSSLLYERICVMRRSVASGFSRMTGRGTEALRVRGAGPSVIARLTSPRFAMRSMWSGSVSGGSLAGFARA
jgi:hypothetical protein